MNRRRIQPQRHLFYLTDEHSAVAADLSAYKAFAETVARGFRFQGAFSDPAPIDIKHLLRLSDVLIQSWRPLRPRDRTLASFDLRFVGDDFHVVDSLAASVAKAMRDAKHVPRALLFLIPQTLSFNKSVMATEIFIPLLEKRRVPAIFISVNHDVQVSAVPARCLPRPQLSMVRTAAHECLLARRDTSTTPTGLEAIEPFVDVMVGHFTASDQKTAHHLGAVVSVGRLAGRPGFVARLRQDVRKIIGANGQIVPVGLDGSAIEALAHAVASETSLSVCYSNELEHLKLGRKTALLTDTLPSLAPLEVLSQDVTARVGAAPAVLPIATFADAAVSPSQQSNGYMRLAFPASASDGGQCVLCVQGVPLQEVSDYHAVESHIGRFDDFTFWSLIASQTDFVSVGHWRSPRTDYHYLFRINTAPIFAMHRHALAMRLRNVLVDDEHLILQWIDAIVCTTGEESVMLAEALAEVLQLDKNNVVKIPRKLFSHITGQVPDQTVVPHLRGLGILRRLEGKNVIIVDQAAHHFGTLAKLQAICHLSKSRVFAFAVFVSRVQADTVLGDFLPHSHYVSLYSWPSPPRRGHECACRLSESAHS